MLVRSEWCTHQHSCLEAAFRGWGTVFGITTSARLLWCGLYRRIFGEKTYQPTTAYLTASTGHDVIPGVLSVERVNNEVRLGLFLSTLVGSIKGINCAMRLIRQKEDSWNSIVAGAVGGLAILICDKKRRLDISLLVFVRALTHLFSLFLNKYDFQIPPGSEIVISSLLCGLLQWATVFYPTLVHYSFYNFIYTFSTKIDKYMLSYLRNLAYRRKDEAETQEDSSCLT